MISPFFYPHLGGVEKHVLQISKRLLLEDCQVEVITNAHQRKFDSVENIFGIQVNRFSYPQIRFFGLLFIWWRMLGYWRLAKKAEIIHVHDVMVWCLPLRLIFPRKKIILTMHGWEGVYPLPKKNILLKQLGGWLANKVVCVGEYVKKYYQVSCDQVVYGGVSDDFARSLKKSRDIQLMFVGRLEADTGLKILLESLSNISKNKKVNLRVVFAGDGKLKAECEDFGTVVGWLDEKDLAKKMRQTKLVVAGGYLSALESLAAGCEVIAIADSPLKKDYWQMSELDWWISVASSSDKLEELILNFSRDLVKSKKPQSKEIMRQYSWKNMTKKYLSLYEE